MSIGIAKDIHKDLLQTLEPVIDQLEPLRNSLVCIVGAGFIGTWLTEAITVLNDRYEFNTKIHVLSLTGDFLKNAAPHLLERKEVQFFAQDCRRSRFAEDANFLVHCHSPLNPQQYQSQPISTFSLISEGVHSFFEAARMLPKLKNILYLSSGTVYGPQAFETERLNEEAFASSDPSILANIYAESKRFAETVCTAYRNEARLPIVIARPFAFVGPYQQSTIPWALHSFIDDAIHDRPIRILGDGESVRSYLYGADAAAWLLSILSKANSGSIYNVGNPESIKLIESAQMVAKFFENRVEISRLRQNAHMKKTRFVPETSKVQDAFGLRINTSTESAINKTIEWILHKRRFSNEKSQ